MSLADESKLSVPDDRRGCFFVACPLFRVRMFQCLGLEPLQGNTVKTRKVGISLGYPVLLACLLFHDLLAFLGLLALFRPLGFLSPGSGRLTLKSLGNRNVAVSDGRNEITGRALL